jgi:hypothetical protein
MLLIQRKKLLKHIYPREEYGILSKLADVIWKQSTLKLRISTQLKNGTSQ